MFSIMTIASSTMKPVPMVSAISDRLSRLKPHSHITANVAMMESGSVMPAMRVALHVRRNSSTTSTTSPIDRASVSCTSKIEARMVPVRSLTTASVTSAGRMRRSFTSSSLMCATVATMLAPGWRRMSMTTAGRPWCQAPMRSFSKPSVTSATSFSSTGAPLRQASVMRA